MYPFDAFGQSALGAYRTTGFEARYSGSEVFGGYLEIRTSQGEVAPWTAYAQADADYVLVAILSTGAWAGTLTVAMKNALIDGLFGAPVGATGFNATLKAALTSGDVTRASDDEVHFALDAGSGIALTLAETVTLTAPGDTWDGGSAIAFNGETISPGGPVFSYATTVHDIGPIQLLTCPSTPVNFGGFYPPFDGHRTDVKRFAIAYFISITDPVLDVVGGLAAIQRGVYMVPNGPVGVATKNHLLSFAAADENAGCYTRGNGGFRKAGAILATYHYDDVLSDHSNGVDEYHHGQMTSYVEEEDFPYYLGDKPPMAPISYACTVELII